VRKRAMEGLFGTFLRKQSWKLAGLPEGQARGGFGVNTIK